VRINIGAEDQLFNFPGRIPGSLLVIGFGDRGILAPMRMMYWLLSNSIFISPKKMEGMRSISVGTRSAFSLKMWKLLSRTN
jgi:hypothetical protein